MKLFSLNFLTIIFSLFSVVSKAQSQEGIIDFETKMNMHKGISAENAQMKAMIPEFRITKNRLFFTANSSYYTNVEEEEDNQEINSNTGGNQVTMKFFRPQNDTYRNFDSQTYVMLTDFAGKKFRVEDTLKSQAWKFVDGSKEIAGYKCSKATYKNEQNNQEIVAWFTDGLVCPSGPMTYWGLPGMILEIDIDEGKSVISAKKIEFKKLESEIKIPKEGKKTTAKEFRKIQDDYMKEMGIKPGASGTPRIIIRNN